MTGSSLLPLLFSTWILDLAVANNAVIVSADYRLMPEATGADILTDVADLWSWVHNDLQSFISTTAVEPPQLDLAHILVAGESAGGWLATQSALTQPAGSIKAAIFLYPQLDLRDPFFNTKFEKPLFGMPMLPNEILDAHIARSTHGAVVTSPEFPVRLDLACAMVQNGRVLEFLGTGEELFPIELVSQAESMPPILILHGSDDSAVPVAGSQRFVDALKKKLPESAIKLDIRPGEHGFDGDAKLEDQWLSENVEFICGHWLK